MYNRGFRRDDHSFRSNMNMSRGNNAPSLMSVSPWEGGVVPGSGGSSILGAPNIQSLQHSNLVTPQAAALAQNLNILSNLGLLQQQLGPRQPQGLPSLVNMASNMNRPLGQHSNYRPMNQMMNRGMPNRFHDQRPNKYGRQDGRRPEPFNKNRPRTSQSQISQQKLQSYRPLNSKVSPQQAVRKPVSQGMGYGNKNRPDMKFKQRGLAKKEYKKPESDKVTEDNPKKDGEGTTPKRDWKTEKTADSAETENDVQEKEESNEPKEETEVENGKGDDTTEQNDETPEEAEAKDPTEAEAKDPTEAEGKEKTGKDIKKKTTFFNCHVCSKNMWDEKALNNHTQSAAHKKMIAQLEETYAVKVKRLRMQMRTVEDQKDLEKARNRGRRLDLISRGHCKMCDLTFYGNIATHRKTQLHLKLKSFLHPNCIPCGMEFPARLEWDLHKLTAAHCKTMASLDRRRKGGEAVAKTELNFSRTIPKFPEGLNSYIADMVLEGADKEEPSSDEETGEDGSVKKKLLKYDPNLPVGLNMLVHGQHCGVCSKFFSKRGDAVEHCKTRTHHDNYLVLRTKLQEAAAQAAEEGPVAAGSAAATVNIDSAALTKSATVATDDDKTACKTSSDQSSEVQHTLDMTPVVCLKRTATGIEEGDWKRRRTRKDEDDQQQDGLNSSEISEGMDQGEFGGEKLEADTDKYDPVDPTPPSPSSSSTNVLDTSFDILQAVEDCIDSGDPSLGSPAETHPQSPAAKPVNKARRGRKRK